MAVKSSRTRSTAGRASANGANGAGRKKAAARKAGGAARSDATPGSSGRDASGWTFLSNHTHVLICLHQDPNLTLREVSQHVGITERSVQRILGELEEAGYLQRERVGLRNRYQFRETARLRHPIEAHCRIGDLIRMVEEPAS